MCACVALVSLTAYSFFVAIVQGLLEGWCLFLALLDGLVGYRIFSVDSLKPPCAPAFSSHILPSAADPFNLASVSHIDCCRHVALPSLPVLTPSLTLSFLSLVAAALLSLLLLTSFG